MWLWIVDWLSVPVVILVLIAMLWHRRHREYPFFFSYLLTAVAAGLVRYAAQRWNPFIYFYSYWISDLIITICSFLAVYELFIKRIFPRFYKIGLYRYLFPSVGALAIFLGWLAAMERSNFAVLVIEDRVLDAVLVVTLVFFGLLMLLMGRQWSKSDFAIAFGFALYASVFLLASTILARNNYRSLSIDLPVIAYDVASLIWLFAFWSPERTPPHGQPAITPELISEARAWQSALKNWISKKG